jgi:glycosyltransferase involved in cell wall biosynthesis
MRRVLITRTVSSHYAAVDLFYQELVQGFNELGWKVEGAARMQPDRWFEILKTEPDLAVALALIPYPFTPNDPAPFAELSTPIIQLTVDHPLMLSYHAVQQMLAPLPNRIVTCIDRSQVREHPTFFGAQQRACFLPHGGCRPRSGSVAPDDERPYNVVFSGSHPSLKQLEQMQATLPAPLRVIVQHMVKRTLDGPLPIFLDTLEEALAFRGMAYDESLFEFARMAYVCWDQYLRTYRRERLLSHLEEVRMPVHIWGRGWNSFPSQGVHLFEGELSMSDTIERYQKAKIVLHISPNFPEGSHERVFTGMLAGAAVVLDRNPYWEKHFKDGQECLMFDLAEPQQLAASLQRLLSDPSLRTEIAARGQARALEAHTWRHRAEELSKLKNV